MRVQADRDICIGAGMCVVAAQEVFDQDDDGLVVLASEDVPVAEEKHAAKRRADEAHVEDEPPESDEAGAERLADAQIGLGQRAQPLINLLEWTAKEEGFILWQADQDF